MLDTANSTYENGQTDAMLSESRSSAGFNNTMRREVAAYTNNAPDYDDGLVHSHAWAYSTQAD